MATSQDFVNWVCSEQLEPDFLKYLFIAEGDDLLRFASGSVHQTIYFPEVKAFCVCHPPLSEQHRIVGILDKAFESIATAKANTEENLQNARAIFGRHLESVFLERGKDWVNTQLGTVAEVQSGGTPRVGKVEYWRGRIPWYTSGELNEVFTSRPERLLTKAGLDSSNAKLFPRGSLLIGMYDTAALKMSILDRDGAFNQAIAGVKPNEDVDLEFLLNAIRVQKPRLLLERRGVRQKNLSLEKIRNIMIPLPTTSVQRAMASGLKVVYYESRRLAQLSVRKLAALERLKQSLLHQAFSGQL
jgi:type I restriction enzyme S subunit